jgi:hypothetical protein
MAVFNRRKVFSTSKKVLLIIVIPVLWLLIGNISGSYKNLVEQNNNLLDQKRIYEQIIHLKANQVEEKAKLMQTLSAANGMFEYYKLPLNIGQNGWIWITIICCGGFYSIFRFLDRKIALTESEIT